MKCVRDGCNRERHSMLSPYCSTECHNLAMRLEFENLIARLDGEDPPEMDDLLDRNERAKRWTPETMAEYLEQVTA